MNPLPLPPPPNLLHNLRHPVRHLEWHPPIRLALQSRRQQRLTGRRRRSEDLKIRHVAG